MIALSGELVTKTWTRSSMSLTRRSAAHDETSDSSVPLQSGFGPPMLFQIGDVSHAAGKLADNSHRFCSGSESGVLLKGSGHKTSTFAKVSAR
jgi:hypothetical protein